MCIRDRIREDGVENLNLFTDFDQTLTKKLYCGKAADSSFKVLTSSPFVSAEYREKSSSMFKYYGPIEKRTDLEELSLIHISEPTRPLYISYAVFCLKKKKKTKTI
eukprot:TRINITY_DN70800_c0_g1_i1.p3 TRINITY_DN70800_c0_g1~~TRINITY_DN70800_c0_g1_i1.p3  ORF type:complete len:106 (-),score=25.28 TRINITY_DN70800_c0_g1_i1:126-443(-)